MVLLNFQLTAAYLYHLTRVTRVLLIAYASLKYAIRHAVERSKKAHQQLWD